MKLKSVFKGVTAVSASLLAIVISGSTLLFNNEGIVNNALHIKTTRIETSEEDENVDTEYYKNEFGTTNTDSLAATLEMEQAVQADNLRQAEEGNVLLTNKNNALPLGNNAKVTLFGNGAANSRYCKSQESTSMDAIEKQTFPTAMKNVFGVSNVNTVLTDGVYKSLSATTSSTVNEADISAVTASASSWQSDYNDAAIVVLTRWGSEDSDSVEITSENRHYLNLSKNEEDLMNYLKAQKTDKVFKKIIVVINADQMMELGWLDDYDVDACLLAGIPGQEGFRATAEILRGDVNPSGRLVDTYVKDYTSLPSMTYAIDHTKTYANADEINSAFSAAGQPETTNHIDYYTIYSEGIYVGYKYYETRYEDYILGTSGAKGTAGSTTGREWNYSDEMAFTFGYGMSYTSFDKTLKNITYNQSSDTYSVTVEVENTGDAAGKEVVQVYAQTPYGNYEKTNKIEKASAFIAGFEKTKTLNPGEKETVTVEIERYLLASYDSAGAKGYILSAGDYYFSIGDGAHDAVNNILAKKGYSAADGMTDMSGQPTSGNAALTYKWTQGALDTDSYNLSRYTDEDLEVTNQFDENQLSYYGIDYTYMTRSDWNASYPDADFELTANQAMIDDLMIDWYETPADAPAVSSFTQGDNQGMMFVTLKDAKWEDDDIWDAFIDQLTVDDMLVLKADGNGNDGVASVGLPSQGRGDDGVCIQQGSLNATGKHAFVWVSEVMTSRTWNKELFASRGKYLGIEAVYCDLNELWYGGGNIHRTPFSGRNMQYYSEDGNFGYYVGQYEAAAMQEVGVIYGIKHLVLNDQEGHRESLSTFATEQTIREVYLRAMEGAIAVSQCGVMTGFNRIGCTYVATHKNLLTNVVKGEWDLKNHITTDAGSNSYKSHALEQLAAGIDYTCWNTEVATIKNAIESGDGYILQQLRLATKYNLYAASRSVSINGLTSNSRVIHITPAWEIALVVVAIVLTVIMVAGVVAYIVLTVKDKKNIS